MAEQGITGDETIRILEGLVEIIKEENVFDTSGKVPVVNFVHPKELQKNLQVTLEDDEATASEIESAIRSIARYSVKTSSRHFHNQLYGGVDAYGLAGAWLSEALNTSQYTYEVAPVFTLLEREILDKALALVGYPSLPESDGILCPGGSMSNMYGMVLARYKAVPEIKTKGLSGQPRLACFSSECGHYSIMKGAHWLGLGTESVFDVKTDSLGRMDPKDLKRAIKDARSKGFLPFFVNATAGTTVLGAFDPIDQIAPICQEEKLWLHIDDGSEGFFVTGPTSCFETRNMGFFTPHVFQGKPITGLAFARAPSIPNHISYRLIACLGGTLLLSKKHRKLLKGIELSNSVAWNPHKMLGTPFQCSIFLVRAKNLMHQANCANATYLFQQDKFYDVSWDTGDKSVQCGRKVDSVKLWLMWKARGTSGLGKSVDVAIDCAEYFYQKIKKSANYRLVLPSYEGNNICFWYIPVSMRGQEANDEWWQKLYNVTSKIKELLVLDGSVMIGYTPMSQKNFGNFFRMVVSCQPPPTHASMDFVLQQIEKFGANL